MIRSCATAVIAAMVAAPSAVLAQFPVRNFDLFAAPAAMARREAARAELGVQIRTAIARTKNAGTWGVMVVSLTGKDTLFGTNADRLLLPASTMKLYTAALALEHFGPNGRFETQLSRTGTLRTDGTLDGDLVLRGAGDPTLGGPAPRNDGPSPIARLARSVADAGITQVNGALVGDATGFADGKVPDGWRRRYLHASYAARVSALSFNENQIMVLVHPEAGKAAVHFRPAVSGIDVVNTVRVVAGSRGARIQVLQDSAIGRIRITGWIGAMSRERDYKLVVENPELFALGALRSALIAEGIKVNGPMRVGASNEAATLVTTLASPPMTELVAEMNGESNNHFAELLFRNVGRMYGDGGTAEASNSLLRDFLQAKAQVEREAVFAADGSGLSTLDRVTPRSMVHLLDYAKQASWGTVLENSLPVAGKTETLARRMRRTIAAGNLRAKTGTTNDVTSLGGYVTAANGEELAFALIYNGRSRWIARDAIDKIGVTLAGFSR